MKITTPLLVLAAAVLMESTSNAQNLIYRFSGTVCDITNTPPAPWDMVQPGDSMSIAFSVSLDDPLVISPFATGYFGGVTGISGQVSGIQLPSGPVSGIVGVENDFPNGPNCRDQVTLGGTLAPVGGVTVGASVTLSSDSSSSCPSVLTSSFMPAPVPLVGFASDCMNASVFARGGYDFNGGIFGAIGFRITSSEVDFVSFSEFCHGDGGNQSGCTDCPCANNATPGALGGCLNSASTSARLVGSGTSSVGSADLRFEANGVPPSVTAVLVSGNALAPANASNPCFGLNSGIQAVQLDGLRCAVQGVLRHGVRPSDPNGDIGVATNGWGTPNGFFNFAAFTPGTTKHFQLIYRDDPSAVCMRGQNTSQAVSVEFQP